MTIRKKTIGVVSIILLLMILCIYLVNRFILLEGYRSLEKEDIVKHADQLSNHLNGELDRLFTVVKDWAPWDDTYRFVQDGNQEFIDNNLMDYTIANLNIDFMVFLDRNGKQVYCKELDPKSRAAVSCSPGLTSVILSYPALTDLDRMGEGIKGYFRQDETVFVLVSSPVLTSQFTGPAMGTLILGYRLSKERVAAMGDQLKLSLEMEIPQFSTSSKIEESAVRSESNEMSREIRSDSNIIRISCFFQTHQGLPAFTMTIQKPRQIFLRGLGSLNSFLISLILIGVVFLGTVLIFLEINIIKRISVLSSNVIRFGGTGGTTGRLPVTGSDEIASLTVEINGMLDKVLENQKRYQVLFDSASDCILVMKDNTIVDCNTKALEFFGRDKNEITGMALCELSPEKQPDGESSRVKCRRFTRQGELSESVVFEWLYSRKDGTTVEAEVSLTGMALPSGYHYQAIIRDISERKKTFRMIAQTEKMMSIGGLAAGMAHEINNPLSGMMQNAQVIQTRLSPDIKGNVEAAREAGISLPALQDYMKRRRVPEMLESINKAGEQAAGIVGNMLQLVRKGTSEKSRNNLSVLLEKTLAIARSDYSLQRKYDYKAIDVVREYQEDVPDVLCEPGSLQQVFFNVIKNAAQAMFTAPSETEKPRLVLRNYREGKHAVVEIEDNGPGMDLEIRQRVFEPFYTTKEVGSGTGLGLSIAFFIIVDDHGGDIMVTSAPGRGTRFIIKLPIS